MTDQGGSIFDELPVARPTKLPGGYPPDLFGDGDMTLGVARVAALMQIATPKIMHNTPGLGIPMMAYIFCRCDPITGESGDCLYEVRAKDPDGDDDLSGYAKDCFAKIVQITAAFGNARAIAMLSEAWLLAVNGEDEKAEADRYRDEHGGSIAGHPRRTEVAILLVQTVDGQAAMFTAPLLRYGRRGRGLAEWELSPGAAWEGRFVGLLQPLIRTLAKRPVDKRATSDPLTAEEMRMVAEQIELQHREQNQRTAGKLARNAP